MRACVRACVSQTFADSHIDKEKKNKTQNVIVMLFFECKWQETREKTFKVASLPEAFVLFFPVAAAFWTKYIRIHFK